MNYHFRSYSEQEPLQASSNRGDNTTNADNISNGTNCGIVNGDNLIRNAQNNPDRRQNIDQGGIIRIYSDSQQSLDRLFNLNHAQSTVPLRRRNLPASFFNPGMRIEERPQSHTLTNSFSNSLHIRSAMFDPRRLNPQPSGTIQGNDIHLRTQSALSPGVGLLTPSANNISRPLDSTSNTNGNERKPTSTSINPPEAQTAWPNNVASNHGVMQQQQHSPQEQVQRQPNSYHYRNFSSPAITSNSTPNQFLQTNHQHITPIAPGSIEEKFSSDGQYSMDTLSPESALSSNFNPARADNRFQSSEKRLTNPPFYYPDQGSSSNLLYNPGQLAEPIQTTSDPYFASNDSIQQTSTNLMHSQPFISYDSALGNSSSMLKPSSQTTSSSSSSNENQSLFSQPIPTPAVHSRSCSFDGRAAAHPVAHVRSQSTIVGSQNASAGGFSSFTPYNYQSRYVSDNGTSYNNDTKCQQTLIASAHRSSLSSSYNQVSLSPITDQSNNVFEECGDI